MRSLGDSTYTCFQENLLVGEWGLPAEVLRPGSGVGSQGHALHWKPRGFAVLVFPEE